MGELDDLDTLWDLGPPPSQAGAKAPATDEQAPARLRAPLLDPQNLGTVLVDAPRITDGMVNLARIGSALGWEPGQWISGALVPDRNAVVLRAADLVMRGPEFGGTNATAEMVDAWQGMVESRTRLRLGALLACLGLPRDKAQVLAFGFQGPPWGVLLVNPVEVEPVEWRQWATW